MPHIHEHYDYTVAFFIVNDKKVLLVNHPRYGRWICPGGHIELDEDPEQALFREIAEETGLEVEILSPRLPVESPGTKPILQPSYVDVHDANLPHRHIGFVYFAASTSQNSELSDEHSEAKWFSREELHDDSYGLAPAIIFYAEQAIKAAASRKS